MKKTIVYSTLFVAAVIITASSCKKENMVFPPAQVTVTNASKDTPYLTGNHNVMDTPYTPVAPVYADTPYLGK